MGKLQRQTRFRHRLTAGPMHLLAPYVRPNREKSDRPQKSIQDAQKLKLTYFSVRIPFTFHSPFIRIRGERGRSERERNANERIPLTAKSFNSQDDSSSYTKIVRIFCMLRASRYASRPWLSAPWGSATQAVLARYPSWLSPITDHLFSVNRLPGPRQPFIVNKVGIFGRRVQGFRGSAPPSERPGGRWIAAFPNCMSTSLQ